MNRGDGKNIFVQNIESSSLWRCNDFRGLVIWIVAASLESPKEYSKRKIDKRRPVCNVKIVADTMDTDSEIQLCVTNSHWTEGKERKPGSKNSCSLTKKQKRLFQVLPVFLSSDTHPWLIVFIEKNFIFSVMWRHFRELIFRILRLVAQFLLYFGYQALRVIFSVANLDYSRCGWF